ncbi:hypothetical protein AVEN_200379-1, partial [Araneus ventricosus]
SDFRKKYRINSSTAQSIRRSYHQFESSGYPCKEKSGGRPGGTAENVERVRDTFLRSPRISTVFASRELGIPQTTVGEC